MPTLLKVGNSIINLDTVTDIELEARSYRDGTPEAEPVVRIHFSAPAIHLWSDNALPTSVTARTLEFAGAEATLLRTHLIYEVAALAKQMEEP